MNDIRYDSDSRVRGRDGTMAAGHGEFKDEIERTLLADCRERVDNVFVIGEDLYSVSALVQD